MNSVNDVNLETIYQSTIKEIGIDAKLFFEESMIVLFNQTVTQDLRDIAVVHEAAPLIGTIVKGDIIMFGNKSFNITFVGDRVNETFKEMGHCTVLFNGAESHDLPGTICVKGGDGVMPEITVSSIFSIKKAT